MFATHPRLKDENISEITVHDVALRGERKAEFVEAFNNANFLYDGGVIKDLSENPIRVRFTQGRTSFAFEMYLYGEQMIEIVRIKNKKYLPYRVRSASLENFLMSLSTIQTSSAN
ncbi:hypothetical protein GCM10025859_53090 [Alicyclobacillus fastidiosus]|nr:hypothetical protein GCM10025859_53090 [Alicyclobacillus fastidiosus]